METLDERYTTLARNYNALVAYVKTLEEKARQNDQAFRALERKVVVLEGCLADALQLAQARLVEIEQAKAQAYNMTPERDVDFPLCDTLDEQLLKLDERYEKLFKSWGQKLDGIEDKLREYIRRDEAQRDADAHS